jgi:MFS family permease
MYVGFFFFALTVGANATLPNAFWAEFYGTANLGSIKAMAAAVMVLGSAIGPGITGVGLDYGISINLQYLFVAGYFVFATVLMWIGITQAKPDLPAPS